VEGMPYDRLQQPGEGHGVRNTAAPVRLAARPSQGLPSDFQPATLTSLCNQGKNTVSDELRGWNPFHFFRSAFRIPGPMKC
jgi:hypothetical protein